MGDDGIGLLHSATPDRAALLRERHSGLTGLYDRAALIGAQLQFDSEAGQGPRVGVSWPAPQSGQGKGLVTEPRPGPGDPL